MADRTIGAAMVVAMTVALAACSGRAREAQPQATSFILQSDAFADGGTLPAQFTCDGDGLSPPLNWLNPPAGTKSIAITVTDPDAPTGNFRHWGAYNIPAGRGAVQAGDGLPSSGNLSQVLNSKDEPQYYPPCPPPGSGPHHYRFTAIALSKPSLDLSEDSTVGDLESAAAPYKLAETSLTVTYERK